MNQEFYDEFSYLCYKYFGRSSVEPLNTYSNILVFLNNIQYDYNYIDKNTELFIPYGENIFFNDFDDIYMLRIFEPFNFVFKVINRKDNIIKIIEYAFMNNRGQITTTYTYKEIDDKEGIVSKHFEESDVSIEEYIVKDYFMQIDETNEIISTSILKNQQLSNYVTSFTNIDDCMIELDDALLEHRYEIVEINNQSLMELNEQLTINKLKNKVNAIK